MSDAASDTGSAPPAPNGQSIPVAPQHPLWQRAAGQAQQGTAGERARSRTVTTTVMGKFGPISMAALELRARNEFDGASSVGSEARPRDSAGMKRHASSREESRFEKGCRGDDGDMDEVNEVEEVDDYDNESEAASGADVLAQAAFGGNRKQRKRADACGSALSITSEMEDGVSVSSTNRRDAHCRAFPVSGVECVGCALPSKVTPVDDFVRSSCDKMQEAALFKMAALIYQQRVAEPARAEDVPVPNWAWKDIRSHYTMHRMDPRMQRFENMRTLAAMRKTLELTLLREDEASGEHVLDKGNAEQIMKIIALQSKEITLLQDPSIGGSRSQTQAAAKKRG